VMQPLLRSPEEGADTLAWLAADDDRPLRSTGTFWLDRRPRSIHKLPTTRRSDTAEERARLWAWCVERSGHDPLA
jgi:dehydrogenase/reductase SDR family member 12